MVRKGAFSGEAMAQDRTIRGSSCTARFASPAADRATCPHPIPPASLLKFKVSAAERPLAGACCRLQLPQAAPSVLFARITSHA